MAQRAKWTEYRAWKYLAQRWDIAARSKRATAKVFSKDCSGVCYALLQLCRMRLISKQTLAEMLRKVPWTVVGFVWPLTPEGAKQRAEFCRRMAKETRP